MRLLWQVFTAMNRRGGIAIVLINARFADIKVRNLRILIGFDSELLFELTLYTALKIGKIDCQKPSKFE
jgi:hypothetical protein